MKAMWCKSAIAATTIAALSVAALSVGALGARGSRSWADNVSPRSAPSSSPANGVTADNFVPSVPHAMDENYAVLTRRSIFIKGIQSVRIFTTSPTTDRATSTAPTVDPDASLVFNGVTRTDESIVAFIEDTTTSTVRVVHVGDAVGHGTISAITIDSLQYESRGRTTTVRIGQSLLAMDRTATATQPTASTDAAPTAPAAISDVEARLRRRRLEELRGK